MKTRILLSLLLAMSAATVCCAADAPAGNSTTEPVSREGGWLKSHKSFVARAKKGDVDILFMGDSITNGWRRQKLWKDKYEPLKGANFGIGGDRTQNVLWRIKNGECDGISPKVVVLMIGTNNMGNNSAQEIADGIKAVVKEFCSRLPKSKLLLLGIFPRSDKPEHEIRRKIKDVNQEIAKLDDGKSIRYLDIGEKFLDAKGVLSEDIMYDFLHLTSKGYRIWADAMDPTLQAMLK
jgi:lysophospholipase L1-like esterase